MLRPYRRYLLPFAALAPVASIASAQNPLPASTRSAIEAALGRNGSPDTGGVLKFSFPRGDLVVVAHGVTLKPSFALGSWLAFRQISNHAMVMGDLVLLESEIAPVMASLQRSGIEQTAVHNHVLGESPRVMYMHIGAVGDPARIARGIRAALELTGTPLTPPVAGSPVQIDLDTAAIARAIGVRGRVNGGVFQISVPRREKIREGEHEVPPSMGISTAINFQPTGAGKAAITGDFVLRSREVNPVARALIESGIQITALHSHLIDENPRLFFMHFWANDDAVKLARGLRTALDRIGDYRLLWHPARQKSK